MERRISRRQLGLLWRRGYGWSNLGPNWDCIGIGDSNGPATVDPAEYITFDLNGGAIATLPPRRRYRGQGYFHIHYRHHLSEKAGQGWFGTLELHGTNIPGAVYLLRPVAYVRQVRHRTVHRQRAGYSSEPDPARSSATRMGFVLHTLVF